MNVIFPERLKFARDKLGVSQEEFARRLGISRASLTLYENGKRVPDIAVLEKIYRETGVSLYFLLGISDVESDSYISINEATGLSQKSIETLCESESIQIFANTIFEQPDKAEKMSIAFSQYRLFLNMCKEQGLNDSDSGLMYKVVGSVFERHMAELIGDTFDYVTEADRAFVDEEDKDTMTAKELFYWIESGLYGKGKSPFMSAILPFLDKEDKNSSGEI
ncbi:MAG: helix-turn-helix transcriptional regulator [Clostridia bacterium]|nr:helix-turn-helix transcriptional regulator [Clostridia bacterium]